MYRDPGWRAAFPKLGVALLRPSRLLAVRPAITAARARVLASLVAIPMIWQTLVFLDVGALTSPSEWWLAAMLASIVAGAFGVAWVRRSPQQFVGQGVAEGFIRASYVLAASGTAPVLIGFVAAFESGGITVFMVGSVASAVLLLGPGRPGKGLVTAWAARMEGPVVGESLWMAVLGPDAAAGRVQR